MASASPIETRSVTEPCMLYSASDNVRSRCANPHQATARFSVFCTHTNNNSSPNKASMSIVRRNSACRLIDMHQLRNVHRCLVPQRPNFGYVPTTETQECNEWST